MEWPILLVSSGSRTDSKLFGLLGSKGWTIESVDSLETAKSRAGRTEYLAIVVDMKEGLSAEKREALFQLRKLQPLAPVFIHSEAEPDFSGAEEELGLNRRDWIRSAQEVHEALSAVLRAEADRGLSDTVILCVDDAPEFLVSMRQWLEPRLEEQFGPKGQPQLEFATSAAEALEIVREINEQAESAGDAGGARYLGLVLTDQKMPRMTGTELLAQVKTIAPRSGRALLTGHAGLDSAVTAINQKAGVPKAIFNVRPACPKSVFVFSSMFSRGLIPSGKSPISAGFVLNTNHARGIRIQVIKARAR